MSDRTNVCFMTKPPQILSANTIMAKYVEWYQEKVGVSNTINRREVCRIKMVCNVVLFPCGVQNHRMYRTSCSTTVLRVLVSVKPWKLTEMKTTFNCVSVFSSVSDLSLVPLGQLNDWPSIKLTSVYCKFLRKRAECLWNWLTMSLK